MDNTFYHKIRYKNTIRKIIAYTSAAMIFTAVPALSVSAAETGFQTTNLPAETPAQQESQPAPGNTSAPEQTPTDTTNTVTATPQAPTDATDTVTATPQAPTDAATVTPPPAPADQGAFDVTPMQGTVYAIIQKGVNVRSGPSTEYAKLGDSLKYGEAITVTGTVNDWYQIQYSGGVGYVRADLVSTTPPDTAQNPADENSAAEPPAAENPAVENPPAELPDTEADSDLMTDEDSTDEDNYVEISSRHLLGTPVLISLAIAVVGVIALICYSVYSLFKKETDTEEYEDEYYEDEEYDDAQYSETEYYEEEPYSDEEYYEEEQYSDEEYYEDQPYSDGEYYEDQPYSDEEYYEERDQYSEYEYPEDKDNK